jgi:nucleotide-binding universal stress UspA family protein
MPVIGERVSVSVRKVLFATDFSVAAEKAASYVRAVAHRYGSKVELVHVFDPSRVETYEAAMVGLPSGERRRAIRENLEQMRQEFVASGIETEAVSRDGHRPAARLLDLAKEGDVDMIVAGTQAKAGLARLMLGSTAEQLVRGAECPVLTVGPMVPPADDTPFNPQRILFATDLTPDSAKAAIFALSFAEAHGAHLYLCHIADDNLASPEQRRHHYHAFESKLRHLIPDGAYEWCTPEFVVSQGVAAEQILGLAAGLHADLIVVGAHRGSSWRSHWEPGVVPSLLAEATCPVLSVC